MNDLEKIVHQPPLANTPVEIVICQILGRLIQKEMKLADELTSIMAKGVPPIIIQLDQEESQTFRSLLEERRDNND